MKALPLKVWIGVVVVVAVMLGLKLGGPGKGAVVGEAGEREQDAVVVEVDGRSTEKVSELSGPDVGALIEKWETSGTFEEWEVCAAGLAEADSVESVGALIQGIFETADWGVRGKLAEHLRAVSNPEVLQVLLGALKMDFGRGSPVVGEICDAISRMAQPDTVAALEALHWGASGQGVESHRILRAVAGIRNPAARRALGKLARNETVAEGLRLAAGEALAAIEAGKR